MPAPCTANGGSTYAAVYTCELTRPGGYTALAVWDTTQTCSNSVCTYSNYTPNSQYTQYRNVAGTVTSITPGQTVQIGAEPILLENMTAPSGYGNTSSKQPSAKADGASPIADLAAPVSDGLALAPAGANATFSYSGLTPTFASTAALNPSYPAVPA